MTLKAEQRFDVFLSYNHLDSARAERLAHLLRRAGVMPWYADWNSIAGVKFQDNLVAGLDASATCAVLVGPHGLSDWESEELAVALDRAKGESSFRVFGVLLPGVPDPFESTDLPAFLRSRTWVDLRAGLDTARARRLLLGAIQGTQPGPLRRTRRRKETAVLQLLLEALPTAHNLAERPLVFATLQDRLDHHRFVLVSGMAGVGKTTLGAQLARANTAAAPDILWYTFGPVERNSVDASLWSAGAFLALRGETRLWRYLRGEIDFHAALTLTAKTNLLLAGLSTGRYVLCFDNFHVAVQIPELAEFFRGILQRGPDLPAAFILMGREFPPQLVDMGVSPLGGLTEVEAGVLVEESGAPLMPTHLFHRLWERTEGNAKLLELSISVLRELAYDLSAMRAFVEGVSPQPDLRDYIMRNIYAHLQPQEQHVLAALSIFPDQVDVGEAEKILATGGLTIVGTDIDALVRKHIITEARDGRIRCHSLVRDFAYRLISAKERNRFHRSAAQYHQRHGNVLEAVYHHARRGAPQIAVRLLTQHAPAIINTGQSCALLSIADGFDRSTLDDQQWFALCRARGLAHATRGNHREALVAYDAALDAARDDADEAEIRREIGIAYYRNWEFAAAMRELSSSLDISRRLDDQTSTANSHIFLGWSFFRLADLEHARAHFDTARTLGLQRGDSVLKGRAEFGRANVDLEEGRLKDALAQLEECRRIFQSAGERALWGRVVTDLARVYGRLGDRRQELKFLKKSIHMHTLSGSVDALRIAYNNLGNLYLRHLHDFRLAMESYEQLMSLARETDHAPMLSIAYAGLADVHLALRSPQKALEYAQEAQRVPLEQTSTYELGLTYRVLGDVWLALGDPPKAADCFSQSINQLSQKREMAARELERAEDGLVRAKARIGTQAQRRGEILA